MSTAPYRCRRSAVLWVISYDLRRESSRVRTVGMRLRAPQFYIMAFMVSTGSNPVKASQNSLHILFNAIRFNPGGFFLFRPTGGAEL